MGLVEAGGARYLRYLLGDHQVSPRATHHAYRGIANPNYVPAGGSIADRHSWGRSLFCGITGAGGAGRKHLTQKVSNITKTCGDVRVGHQDTIPAAAEYSLI